MARKKNDPKPLPAIWHAGDDLRTSVERVLAALHPPARYVKGRIDQRAAI